MGTPAGITGQDRLFEITLTVSLADDGEVPAPGRLPAEVSGYWTEVSAAVKTTLTAASASEAVAAVEAMVPELARAAGVTVTVHAPGDAERARGEEALSRFKEAAARATPEQRAWAEREAVRLAEQTSQHGGPCPASAEP